MIAFQVNDMNCGHCVSALTPSPRRSNRSTSSQGHGRHPAALGDGRARRSRRCHAGRCHQGLRLQRRCGARPDWESESAAGRWTELLRLLPLRVGFSAIAHGQGVAHYGGSHWSR